MHVTMSLKSILTTTLSTLTCSKITNLNKIKIVEIRQHNEAVDIFIQVVQSKL